jgi:hypothetical protein
MHSSVVFRSQDRSELHLPGKIQGFTLSYLTISTHCDMYQVPSVNATDTVIGCYLKSPELGLLSYQNVPLAGVEPARLLLTKGF